MNRTQAQKIINTADYQPWPQVAKARRVMGLPKDDGELAKARAIIARADRRRANQ